MRDKDKFKIPIFQHAGYTPSDEVIRKVKEANKDLEQGKMINSSCPIISALLSTPLIIKQIFKGGHNTSFSILDERSDINQELRKDSGIDLVVVYLKSQERLQFAVHANFFNLPPESFSSPLEESREKNIFLDKVYKENEEIFIRTLRANNEKIVGPLIYLRVPDKFYDRLSEILADENNENGNFVNYEDELQSMILWIRDDLKQQLMDMILKLIVEYLDNFLFGTIHSSEKFQKNVESKLSDLVYLDTLTESLSCNNFVSGTSSYIQRACDYEDTLDANILEEEDLVKREALRSLMYRVLQILQNME